MKFRSRLIAISAAMLLALIAAGHAQLGSGFGKKVVTATMVANTAAIEAGKPFTVGVRFEIEPAWHIYWEFPGDLTLPTTVDWELPPGFKAGPLQWPLPEVMTGGDDFLNYVYEHETLLFAEITPPASLPPGPLTLKAKVTWQECDPNRCIRDNGDVAMSVEPGVMQPANAELFAKYRAQLPKQGGQPFSVKWERSAGEVKLHVSGLAKDFKAEFLPLPPGKEVKPGHPVAGPVAEDGARTITVPITEGGAAGLAWRGVLVTSKGDAPREGWEIAVDDATASAPVASGAAPAKDSQAGLAATLWAAFLGGLILNLMPCVLPVIALKIFGFVQQANDEPRRVFRLGLAFVAGVFAFFLALAGLVIALRAGGGRLNWGFQFQNQYILTTLIALVFIFAMSMFGVFEVTLGSGAATKLDTLSRRDGYGGAFVHGLFTTLLGTSCTAPFLGPVLGFAVVQPPPVVVAIFLAIAAGMSLPYFLLTWHPAWMKFLPKPGAWMERVKQLMGFVLMGVVVWLLGVLGQSRGVNAMASVSAFLLVLGVASWAFGAIRKRAFAWVVVVVLAVGGWGWFLKEAAQPAGIAWQPYTPERLIQAVQGGRPVFIDFTADWCLNCHYNEKFVLETEPVRAAFRAKKIVALKADWTNGDPAITEMLKKFNRAGVPAYVIYRPGSTEPIVLPEILTQTLLLHHLAEIKEG